MKNREELKKNAKEQLDTVFAQVEKMEANSDHVSEDLKKTYREELEKLRLRKADMKTKYHQLEDASEEKIEELHKAFSESKEHFAKGVKKLADAIA